MGDGDDRIALAPNGPWTADGGEINPLCDPPNPAETSFAASGGGSAQE